MRHCLLAAALLAAASPLAAQQADRLQTPAGAVTRDAGAAAKLTRADTAAMLRAAADSVWRPAGVISVVADTAWVTVMRATGTYRRDPSGASDETAVGFTQEIRRVERRKGKWVRLPN